MDLQTIFSTVCNMTITASVVIGCVLLARLALSKAPRGFACALWLVVLFRLLCPVAPSAPVSVLNIVDAPKTTAGVSAVEYVPLPEPTTDAVAMIPGRTGTQGQIVTVPAPEVPRWRMYASVIWLAGAGSLIGYGVTSYVNLKKKMRASIALAPGVRESDRIDTPFVLGFFRPIIYLPEGLEGREHILLHERCHVRWGDPLVKGLFYLACCLHWFNPLAWLAFVLSGRDMELRCDETVLRALGEGVRSDYAQSLLNFAAGRRMAPAPLAFGEGDTGKRVRHVLGWKKKAAWALIPAAILCAVVLLITAVNPGGKNPDSPFGHSYRMGSVRASSEKPAAIDGSTLYTLTSDMGLFVRSEKTELVGFFRKESADWEDIRSMPEFMKRGDLRRCWRIAEEDWWLLELEDGARWLFDGSNCVMFELVRTDLLGVSIKQPGIESYVEPVWYRTGEWNWMSDEMSATLLRGDAQIVLIPETDVDKLLVEEEYHDYSGEAAGVIVSHHVLEPDGNGDFLLDVPHRSSEEGNFSVYRVTVGEDHYIFRVRFSVAEAPLVEEPTQAVTFTHDNAFITLQIPESWGSSTISPDDEEYDASMTGGISFWPAGRAEGKVFFGYYPDLFAVCGTGLETTAMTLAGQTASVGTYDDHEVWDFIRFSDHFAVWGQDHEAWWAEYGEQAMAILDSAVFSEAGIDLSDWPEGEIVRMYPASPTEP